jgi:hypothetical protein
MKKQILLLLLAAVLLSGFSQETLHDVSVINIEVAVRVFKGDSFVENLTMDDFEVYEDGKLQKIEAVYLIKKTKIQRKEEKKKFNPETQRNFYLFFEISEYTPRLKDAVDYFVSNVLAPGDQFTVVTPMKTYRMKNKSFDILSKKEITQQLGKIIRRDSLMGYSEYRNIIAEMADLAKGLSGVSSADGRDLGVTSMDSMLIRYTSLLSMLENLRRVDEKKMLDFSRVLKSQEGQKNVFLIYQREVLPQLESNVLSDYMNIYHDQPAVVFNLSYLFDFFRRDLSFNIERVKQAFSDSSIAIQFLFFTKPTEHIPGLDLVEHSSDIFSAFYEMAGATGGITDTSANPLFLFKKASSALEDYYLLYYSPKDYREDGKFKNITVKVKNRRYKVTHRAGYIAD